jgi:hypothetical protein
MLRPSDFVRPSDVLDPDRRSGPTETVDYDRARIRIRGSIWAVVCVLGMMALAVLQPHARNFVPAGVHSVAPVAAMYPH